MIPGPQLQCPVSQIWPLYLDRSDTPQLLCHDSIHLSGPLPTQAVVRPNQAPSLSHTSQNKDPIASWELWGLTDVTLNSSGLVRRPPPTGENTPVVLRASESSSRWGFPGSVEVSHPLPLKPTWVFIFEVGFATSIEFGCCFFSNICLLTEAFGQFSLNAIIDMVQFKLLSCYLFSICSICSLFFPLWINQMACMIPFYPLIGLLAITGLTFYFMK